MAVPSGWIEHGSGIFERLPEKDPEKIKQAEQRFNEWKERFDLIMELKQEHGWDSEECQLARIEMRQWQQAQRQGGCLAAAAHG